MVSVVLPPDSDLFGLQVTIKLQESMDIYIYIRLQNRVIKNTSSVYDCTVEDVE